MTTFDNNKKNISLLSPKFTKIPPIYRNTTHNITTFAQFFKFKPIFNKLSTINSQNISIYSNKIEALAQQKSPIRHIYLIGHSPTYNVIINSYYFPSSLSKKAINHQQYHHHSKDKLVLPNLLLLPHLSQPLFLLVSLPGSFGMGLPFSPLLHLLFPLKCLRPICK